MKYKQDVGEIYQIQDCIVLHCCLGISKKKIMEKQKVRLFSGIGADKAGKKKNLNKITYI